MHSTLLLPCLVPALYGTLVAPSPTLYNNGLTDHSSRPFQLYGRPQQPVVPSFIARLRDGAIQLIWGPPPQSTRKSYGQSGKPVLPGQGVASKSLLARYGGDVVLRFNITSAKEAEALAQATNILFLDVWEHTSEWADIRLAKDVVPSLLGLLPTSLQHAHTPLMHDLAMSISESYPFPALADPFPSQRDTHHSFSHALRTSPEETNIFFQDYQPLSVIHPWMRLLQSLFPTHVQLVNIGTSSEGRDILGLRVGVHPTNTETPSIKRKTIVVSGGAHAREWISTSSVTYAAYSLITSYGKSRLLTKLVEQFDWIFIPTLNPDGYVYTWESDRLWRKNRQATSLHFCKGIDIDRSYPFQWDGEATKGNPCSESFSGDGPFEAVEAHRFASWVLNETENNNAEIVGFLDFHSYSQQILYPFSYSCVATPPTLENLEELGLGLAKAIRQADDRAYGVTSACEGSVVPTAATGTGDGSKQGEDEPPLRKESPSTKRLWPRIESGGGSMLDYMYHEAGVKYAFQVKLRDRGGYGFLLPRKNIVPSGREVFNAVTFFGKYVLSNKGIEAGSAGTEGEDSREEDGRRGVGLRFGEENNARPAMRGGDGGEERANGVEDATAAEAERSEAEFVHLRDPELRLF